MLLPVLRSDDGAPRWLAGALQSLTGPAGPPVTTCCVWQSRQKKCTARRPLTSLSRPTREKTHDELREDNKEKVRATRSLGGRGPRLSALLGACVLDPERLCRSLEELSGS